jgi:endonuclease YncB( thermonuclease family)
MAAYEAPAASRTATKAPECPGSGTRVVSFGRAVSGGGFLTADGEEVRLAGVLATDADSGALSEPAAAAAREALTRVLRDRTVTLALAEAPRDRYGRTVAHVFADGTWVQATLLVAGEALAAPDAASAPCAAALLAAEAEARERRAGQWRSAFRVRDPNDLRNRVGSFQIVEGEVMTASVTRGRAFTVLWRKRHFT